MQTVNKNGFTLIELSLSIAFIGVLSLAVALIITNTISAYRRGLTLNQVNTTGAAIVDELRTTIKESPVRAAAGICDDYYHGLNNKLQTQTCEADNALKLINVIIESKVGIGQEEETVPVYGAFCTGSYSYIWNSGYFFSDDYDKEGKSPIVLKYKSSVEGLSTTEINGFKLLKVKDSGRFACQKMMKSEEYVIQDTGVIDMGFLGEEPVDILKNADIVENNLAVYNLSIASPAVNEKAHSAFYKVSLILGTVQGGINLASRGNFCTTPEDYNNDSVENFDYCSINKFNFAVQANGG